MPRKRNKAGNNQAINSENCIEDLLSEANKHIDEFEFENALGFCDRALRLDDKNIKALETCANVLLEIGRLTKARDCLEKAVSISPDVGHSKYFSLAQLSEGQAAVNFYKKGIKLLKNELQYVEGSQTNLETDKNYFTLKRKLSNAYCSIAEIYTTDLCDEEGAEEQCSVNIEHSISADDSNPEAYQAKANFVMFRENTEEAKQLMMKSLSLWLPKTGDATNSNEECPLSFEARISCSKLLVELKEYQFADQVLTDLLGEDDECVEVWYLLGLLNYLKEGDDDAKKEAKFYFLAALKVYEKTGCSEVEMKAHMEEMLEELKDVLVDGEGEEDEENKENEDDSVFSTTEDEDEDEEEAMET